MKQKLIQLPFGAGRILLSADWERNGSARMGGGAVFGTNLSAEHFDFAGRLRRKYDLGSGVVTNVGSLALAQDGLLVPSPSGTPNNLLALLKYHGTGTGTVADAVTDIKLGTPFTGNTAPVVTGVNTLVPVAAGSSKIQSVATTSYDTGAGASPSTTAITEWGLFSQLYGTNSQTLTGDAASSPATAGGATTLTVTGTPFTASDSTHAGKTQNIVEFTHAATAYWGLITSNTSSILTVPAWYKTSDGTAAGLSPVNTDTLVLRPVMFDRRKFNAINVSNGDSIVWTYTLTFTSGG